MLQPNKHQDISLHFTSSFSRPIISFNASLFVFDNFQFQRKSFRGILDCPLADYIDVNFSFPSSEIRAVGGAMKKNDVSLSSAKDVNSSGDAMRIFGVGLTGQII